MVIAKATRRPGTDGWIVADPVSFTTYFFNGDEFGDYLAHKMTNKENVQISLTDTDCDECGAAPNENHVFGCQYLLD